MNRVSKIGLLSVAALSLTACVSMPDFGDNPPPSDIADEIANNRSFPDVRNAPILPTDIRGNAQWEGAVSTLTTQGTVFDQVNADAPIPTSDDILNDMSNLKTYVDGHIIDDAK